MDSQHLIDPDGSGVGVLISEVNQHWTSSDPLALEYIADSYETCRRNIRSASLAEADIHYRHRSTDDLTRIITICATPCECFDNRCNDGRFPDGCLGRRQWLKALSSVGFRECPRWQDGQAG